MPLALNLTFQGGAASLMQYHAIRAAINMKRYLLKDLSE
jgi:hypothetical protein